MDECVLLLPTERGGKEGATKGRRAHSTPPFHYLRIDPFKASLQIHHDFWVGQPKQTGKPLWIKLARIALGGPVR